MLNSQRVYSLWIQAQSEKARLTPSHHTPVTLPQKVWMDAYGSHDPFTSMYRLNIVLFHSYSHPGVDRIFWLFQKKVHGNIKNWEY